MFQYPGLISDCSVGRGLITCPCLYQSPHGLAQHLKGHAPRHAGTLAAWRHPLSPALGAARAAECAGTCTAARTRRTPACTCCTPAHAYNVMPLPDRQHASLPGSASRLSEIRMLHYAHVADCSLETFHLPRHRRSTTLKPTP